MKRIQHSLVQGTPEWAAFRAEHDGASEAAAMLGLSKYMTRNELLRQKATGIAPEVDNAKQGLFDAGHQAEAAARPIAEEILSDELFPAVFSYGRLSASVDGLTMDGATAWEHKLRRADLAASVERNELPDEYMTQCQQIMLVTGAEKVLFMVSDGTPENCAHMWVERNQRWMMRIESGWAQFHADLADYQPPEVIPTAVAAPTMALPALSIQVQIEQDEKTKKGSITVIDNLKVFGERLESFISGLNLKPADDQAFADAEAAIKTLGTAETELEAEKARALAKIAAVDEMTRTVALYAAQARNCRLMLTKLVKDRKESIRIEIVIGGRDALAAHIAGLNKRLGKQYMPTIVADFAGSVKGKKTLASLRDAVDSELARVKIEANKIADRIQVNVNAYREMDTDYGFLFSDLATIILKENDDFIALVKMRVSEHCEKEAKRIEAEAEKARERIRAEEAVKAKAEQERIARAEREAQDKLALEMHQREESLARERRESEANLAKEQAAARAGIEPITKPEFSPELAAAAAPYGRPRDDALIAAVALAFDVNADIARRWLVEAFAGRMAA